VGGAFGVGLPVGGGLTVGVPVAPGIGLILMVIALAAGKVVPLEITIWTPTTPGWLIRYFRAFSLLMLAM